VVNQHNGTVTMAASTNNNVDIGTTVVGSKVSSYLLDGGTLSVFGPNGGNVRLAGAGSADSSGSFVLTNNGVLQVNGSILGNASGGAGSQVFSFLGGTLSCSNIDMTYLANALGGGTGTLTNQGGTLSPGDSGVAGKTAITGNYSASATANLSIDLNGTTPATAFTNSGAFYDTVAVSGTATLGGNLIVRTNGFTPTSTSGFTILTAGSGVSGTFANVTGGRVTVVGSTNTFAVVYSANSVILTNYNSSGGGGSTPSPAPITYIYNGSQLVLNWPNGVGWVLQAQTNNLATGLAGNWVRLTGVTSPFTNNVNPANGTVFYRLISP
jgi:hypothetical protein